MPSTARRASGALGNGAVFPRLKRLRRELRPLLTGKQAHKLLLEPFENLLNRRLNPCKIRPHLFEPVRVLLSGRAALELLDLVLTMRAISDRLFLGAFQDRVRLTALAFVAFIGITEPF